MFVDLGFLFKRKLDVDPPTSPLSPAPPSHYDSTWAPNPGIADTHPTKNRCHDGHEWNILITNLNLKKQGSLNIFSYQPLKNCNVFFSSKSLQIETTSIDVHCWLDRWSPCWGSTSFGGEFQISKPLFFWKTLHVYECDSFITIISVYFKVTFRKTNMTMEKKNSPFLYRRYIFIHHSCLFILVFFHCHLSFPEV